VTADGKKPKRLRILVITSDDQVKRAIKEKFPLAAIRFADAPFAAGFLLASDQSQVLFVDDAIGACESRSILEQAPGWLPGVLSYRLVESFHPFRPFGNERILLKPIERIKLLASSVEAEARDRACFYRDRVGEQSEVTP